MMSWTDSLIFAATLAVVCSIGIEKIMVMDWDFTELLPSNRRRAKMKRLMEQRPTPLHKENIPDDIRKQIEAMLLPLWNADVRQLPPRMDRTFRRESEHQIGLLRRRGLRREIRFADMKVDTSTSGRGGFTRWNDSAREWREATVTGTILERFISGSGDVVARIYHSYASLTIRQSRRIRHDDRMTGGKDSYYDILTVSCPSCGGEVKLDSQQVNCPYCGAFIQNSFHDWQTESMEIYESRTGPGANMHILAIAAGFVFVPSVICFRFIPNLWLAALAGVVIALVVFLTYRWNQLKKEELPKEIVRYSENQLRSCISELFWESGADADEQDDLLEYSIGRIRIDAVENRKNTTTIDVDAVIRRTRLPENGRPVQTKESRTLKLQRARYPERQKARGDFVTEKECPSCGANFLPDEEGCCSYCGYGLPTDNAKWKPVRNTGSH